MPFGEEPIINDDGTITYQGETWMPAKEASTCNVPVSCYYCTEGCGSPHQEDKIT